MDGKRKAVDGRLRFCPVPLDKDAQQGAQDVLPAPLVLMLRTDVWPGSAVLPHSAIAQFFLGSLSGLEGHSWTPPRDLR